MATYEELCAANNESWKYYLELSECKLKFDATSQLTSIFYDESNSQIFSIHSGGQEVVVKSPNKDFCKKFKMEEKGHITSIKFSPDMSILSVQRSETSVDFLTLVDDKVSKEFTHTFKTPNTLLLGYMWTGKNELIFITDQGVKLCKIDVQTSAVSLLKSMNVNVNWFNYFGPICLLLLNSGHSCRSMQLLQIKQNQILKLAKFELDLDMNYKTPKTLSERDVVLGVVYNLPRILVMTYQNVNGKNQAELVVYTIIKLSSVKKTHLLRIDQTGCFAVNLVDNLIIVHNQESKSSMVFDITESEFQGSVSYHYPIVDPKSIKGSNQELKNYDLYSRNWVMFQPNIVMDAKLGYLWHIQLNLYGFLKAMTDKNKLTSFLLLRSDSERVIAYMLEHMLEKRDKSMTELGSIFDQINAVYRSYLELNLHSQMSMPVNMSKIEDKKVVVFKTVIDQSFMFSHVFSKLEDKINNDSNWKESRFVTWALLEYIRSLVDFQITVYHNLYEILINSLVKNGNFYQLHQLLQYHAVEDSKPLACLLLSLENLYPAAPQLAIDMLERIGNKCSGSTKEEITEILLYNKQLLSSLRYSKKHSSPHDRICETKYLDAARNIGNEKLVYTILTHFNLTSQLRNGNLLASDGSKMFP
ncbi:hypothetical protein AAG570_001345 [Ranatra chinensis]|uniref:Mic1 domain-containing protein n=1 Tax=Ranatra chinensis TaxID=642074 RepID=A0ABD0YNA4_9HEMI